MATRGRQPSRAAAVLGAALMSSVSLALTTPAVVAAPAGSEVDPVLTPEQEAWLDEHDRTVLLGADDMYRPYVFFDANGELTGITGDYVALLEQRLDMTIEAIRLPGFTETLAAAETREIDIVPNVVFSEDRPYLVFTEPYVTVIDRIFVRVDTDDGDVTLADLRGRQVASVDGYTVSDFIENEFPEIEAVRVDSEVEGLRALSTGAVDALVADLGVVSYTIREEGITNLRVAGSVDSVSNQRFGVRSDQPILRDVLDAGLATITEAERDQITQRWIPLDVSSTPERTGLWALGLLAGGTVVVAVLVVIWNRALRRSVRRQTEVARRIAEERARAEAQRSRLELAISHAAELVVVVDADWSVRYLNPTYERVSGRSATEPIGGVVDALFAEVPDRTSFDAVRQELAATGLWRGRLALRGPDEDVIPVDGAIASFTLPDGEAGGYVGTLRDATHEEQLQDELERADRLRAVGTLAAGIAHDFNNLLMPIVGNVDLIAATDDVELRARYLRSIREAAQRATELVAQVRSFSVDEQIEPSLFDLRGVVGEAVALVGHSATPSIAVSCELPDDAVVVSADPGRIHQLVMNLLTNALQAMEASGGELRVAVGRVRQPVVGDDDPVAHAELVVSDTGTGIDERTMARVFDPYFSTRHASGGSGLGLFTAIGVVQSLGGDIRVESTPGRGTAMRVLIPLADGEVTPATGLRVRAISEARRRILLVDDDDAVREVVAAILTRLGHDVDTQSSGVAALARLDEGAVADLLITDLGMPDMRGDELARLVEERLPGIAVIVLTGFYDADDLESGWTVVEKPVSMSRLGHAVTTAVVEPIGH